METKLVKIAEISATTKHPIFTSVYHLINEDMLKQCHKELDGSKAVGIDKVTKDEYGKNLDRNIKDLVQRLKNKSFKPLPSLRVYIPKANGKKRPLGIASYEDKIVQMAVKKILGAIYEPRFLNCMYGFRPNRGCHEAIKEVYQRISYGKISYIVDADIKGFFDHIDHEWMMKFLEWNIQDKNLLWLIRKYLKAGIMEQGKFEPTEEGSAQGSVMSPMLANIYMHHVLTLWFKLVVKKEMQGECFLVNFADDFVAGFQYKSEAERYYKELKERMEKFGLELESSKSRLIEFGRFAEQNRRARGEHKPETFDFLGFTFYCSKNRKGGFVPKVQTSRKKFEQKLKKAIEENVGIDYGRAKTYTVGSWLEVWMENYAKVKLRPSTFKTSQGFLKNHIKPQIGGIPLADLTSLDLQRFYKHLLDGGRVDRIEAKKKPKGLAPKTVRNIHQMIGSAYNLAMEQKLVTRNPTQGCALPKVEHKEMKTLTADQLSAFFQEARDSGVYELYYLDLATGLRRGELLGLKWADADLDRGVLKIQRAISRQNGKVVEAPLKTKNAYRTLPLSADAIDVLMQQRRKTGNSEWVFPSPSGGPMSPDSVLHMLQRVLKRAGLPRIRFHDLRHTFATMALQNGVDVKTVSSMLGHYSAGFTLDTYAHVTTDAQLKAAQTMGNILSRAV